jgi:hypothetical protein
MRWSREELDERVETLADAHEGREFVQAVSRFAEEELEADDRELLGRILLERAEEEYSFQEAARRRVRERGWWRRTVRRVEDLVDRGNVRGDARRVAAAVVAKEADPEAVEAVLAELRADRGWAARILDELSRDRDPEVRAWVSRAAREVLEEGGVYILMGLTRDRDQAVRDAAIANVVALDPQAARRLVPSLRRRVRSPDEDESVFAMWTLAELGDRAGLPQVRRIAESAEPGDRSRQRVAEAVSLLLGERPEEVLERVRAHDHDLMPWLAVAARLLGTDEARAVLAEHAEGAPDPECRALCRAELEKLEARTR